MKNLIILLICALFSVEILAQDSTSVVYPWQLSGKVSILNFNNSGLSNEFGNITLFGAGLGKKISSDFKLDFFFDFGATEVEDVKVNYSHVGGVIKYAWYNFGSNRPNLYGGLGAANLSLKLSGSGYGDTDQSSTLGFIVLIGIEIPLNNVSIDLGWNSTYGNMNFAGENLNVGSQIFYGGLIISL